MPRGSAVLPPLVRLMAMVEVQPNGCWWFTGYLDENGYGRFRNGRGTSAHIASYELHIGPVPDGLVLDHTCHDPNTCKLGKECPHRKCCNPEHLDPVTVAENSRRGGAGLAHSTKTHCPNGHEYTPENIFRRPQRPNERECRVCRRKRTTDWKEETGYVRKRSAASNSGC